MFLSEVVLLMRYFANGQKLKFFAKIQSGRNDLLRTLSGMTWDLYHFRQVTHMLSKGPTQDAHYYFPAMLTFDKGFAEIIDIYSLCACGIGPGAYDFVTAPACNFFEQICIGMDGRDRDDVESLFSPDAVARRSAIAEGGGVDFRSIARSLIADLSSIVGRRLEEP